MKMNATNAVLFASLVTGAIVYLSSAQACDEGCSDTHDAESYGGAANINCRIFEPSMCTTANYDKVTSPETGWYQECSLIVPTKKSQVWGCNCDEACSNVVPTDKREMDYAEEDFEDCSNIGRTDRRFCDVEAY